MKNTIKIKYAAFLLILALTTILFLSCSPDDANKDAPDDNSRANAEGGENAMEGETATEEEIKDSLPGDLDFGGQTLNLFTFAAGNSDFYAESETGDLINDAKYKSIMSVEERLNMKVNFIRDEDDWNSAAPFTKIRANINAGDQPYDIIDTWGDKLATLSVDGLFMNMHDVMHLDLSGPWWNKSVAKELTIGGKLYLAAGDANKSVYDMMACIFVNKKFMQDQALPNLYEVVFEGKWTLDYMNDLIKNLYFDLNGNGIADDGDQYGIVHNNQGNSTDLVLTPSADAHFFKMVDGYPSLEPEHEKLIELVEKTYDRFYQNPGTLLMFPVESIENFVHNKFVNGETLLVDVSLGYAGGLRDMESDYGILPFPKLNERQDQYSSAVYIYAGLMAIPANCEKTELAGAFMEASAFDAYKNILPIYFDIVMNVKYARDEETSQMIDIIKNSANFRFEQIYHYAIPTLECPMYTILVQNKSRDFASWYEKYESKIAGEVDKFIDKIKEIK
ncbi:MAG: extracellular solute-binding protein [Oscillospiraceae bacterium]|nr:extracellular solute-binding protein [Oscillospiraceae bacterium]